MLYLALSILFSSLIFVIFKLFSVYKVNTLYAIIINYIIAFVVGILFYEGDVASNEIPQKSWFWGTLLLGCLFIVVFNLMAATAQRVGVSVASVATKMSLVVPVLFGVLVYREQLSTLQVMGIILALGAVYFASAKGKSMTLGRSSFWLPLLVFLGSGIIDTSLKYVQETHIEADEFPLFSATVFGSAAIVGLLLLTIKSFKIPLNLGLKDILGGVALGVPNYFSIYFLLHALQHPSLNSAAVFTINNVAIVMFSTLLGIALFKEHMSTKNWGGIALAVISIVLVALF
ncbi:DMT family transporter [Ulvibacterium marinum]|uniref:DMT family transporter n=1 Tax=Ulvibacterium marinum TaxID=2419782 RepID=A0A3B0CBN6_9FLAO|nr:DMT family transporter [Ulvibacterium marinum]RKN81529.1 DMT family transporter [Ulvibacterium marinum]